MDRINALELPDVTLRIEYRTWTFGVGEWRTWEQGPNDSYPWPSEQPYVQDGKLIVNNNRLPGQGDNYYRWWSFRVFLDGLSLPYAAYITARMTGATVYGSQIEVGGNYDTRFDVYGYNDPATGTGVVDDELAPVLTFLGGYDSGDIVGSILIELDVKPPFWTDHVLSSEII